MEKSIAVALSAVTIMAMVAGCGSNTATNDQKKIGVIQLVEHPSLDAANKGFVDGLASKGYKDGQNIKLDQQNAQADQSNLNSIAQRFVSDKKRFSISDCYTSSTNYGECISRYANLGYCDYRLRNSKTCSI